VTLVRSEAAQRTEQIALRRFAAGLGGLIGAYAMGMVLLSVLANGD
jgi:hypothetical protein